MSTTKQILQKGSIPRGGGYKAAGLRAAEGTIPFGVGVQLGTDKETQVKKYAGGSFRGIALREGGGIPALDGSNNKVVLQYYPDKHPVSVVYNGPITVEVLEAVAPDDQVYCCNTTGNFRKSATGATLVDGAKFDTAATFVGDNKYAIVLLNLPA